PAPTEVYTLSLHDALPILIGGKMAEDVRAENPFSFDAVLPTDVVAASSFDADAETEVTPFDALPEGWLGLDIGPETRDDFSRRRSEEHTSELQSLRQLVCR